MDIKEHLPDKQEVLEKCIDALDSCTKEKVPYQELIALGEALKKMGVALKGVSVDDARKILMTAYTMNQNGLLTKMKDEKKEARP